MRPADIQHPVGLLDRLPIPAQLTDGYLCPRIVLVLLDSVGHQGFSPELCNRTIKSLVVRKKPSSINIQDFHEILGFQDEGETGWAHAMFLHKLFPWHPGIPIRFDKIDFFFHFLRG